MRMFGTDVIHNEHNHPVAGGNVRVMPERITLPLPPALGDESKFEMEVYARFMRHLRQVPNSRMEIKILSAIQFTADMMDHGDALVAKMLADMGLRAPRKAFPQSFLDFADKALARASWDQSSVSGGHVPDTIAALKDHWDRIGEDRFTPVMTGRYSTFAQGSRTLV